jgi:hypothetical protein
VPKRPKRNDPLRMLRARKQISADQYRAGRAWQKLHKQSATPALARCHDALGQAGTALIEDVLARGMSVTVAAAGRGMVSRREIEYCGLRLREALATLAEVFERNDRPHSRLPHRAFG